MKTITKTYTVYTYDELNANAKENVKNWYLEGNQNDSLVFDDSVKEDLNILFPNSDLHIQYDIDCCQGSGFNIYGSLNIYDVQQFCDSEKEKNRLMFYYQNVEDEISLPRNRYYTYCKASSIDFADDWSYSLHEKQFKNIDDNFIYKIQNKIKDKISALCKQFYNFGYQYFYEVSEEDLQKFCNANDYYFTEDGKFFA